MYNNVIHIIITLKCFIYFRFSVWRQITRKDEFTIYILRRKCFECRWKVKRIKSKHARTHTHTKYEVGLITYTFIDVLLSCTTVRMKSEYKKQEVGFVIYTLINKLFNFSSSEYEVSLKEARKLIYVLIDTLLKLYVQLCIKSVYKEARKLI